MLADGVVSGIGLMGTGTGSQPAAIRAHHGSMSREARLEMERESKRRPTPRQLVATSSLELGIDIGSIDLVVQLHAPKERGARFAAGRAVRSLGGADFLWAALPPSIERT